MQTQQDSKRSLKLNLYHFIYVVLETSGLYPAIPPSKSRSSNNFAPSGRFFNLGKRYTWECRDWRRLILNSARSWKGLRLDLWLLYLLSLPWFELSLSFYCPRISEKVHIHEMIPLGCLVKGLICFFVKNIKSLFFSSKKRISFINLKSTTTKIIFISNAHRTLVSRWLRCNLMILFASFVGIVLSLLLMLRNNKGQENIIRCREDQDIERDWNHWWQNTQSKSCH